MYANIGNTCTVQLPGTDSDVYLLATVAHTVHEKLVQNGICTELKSRMQKGLSKKCLQCASNSLTAKEI